MERDLDTVQNGDHSQWKIVLFSGKSGISIVFDLLANSSPSLFNISSWQIVCDLGCCDVGVSITEGGDIYLVLVTCQTLYILAVLTTLWVGQLFYFVDKN